MEATESKAVDEFIAGKQIGARIRRLRLKRSMGLVELGRHTGLSASFLSQLETGRVVPTLRNLTRISMVFSKDLSYFFDAEPRSLFQTHRRKDRIRLPQDSSENPAYHFESLGYHVPDRQLDPYWAEFPVLKRNAEVKVHSHPGYEFLYVTEGMIEMKHGETTEVLEPGDSVYFDASTAHSYRSSGKEPARAIVVTSVLMLQTNRAEATEKAQRLAAQVETPVAAANGNHAEGMPAAGNHGNGNGNGGSGTPKNGNGNGSQIMGAIAASNRNGTSNGLRATTAKQHSPAYSSSPNGAFRTGEPVRRRPEM